MRKFTPLDMAPYFNAGRDNAPLSPSGRMPWQENIAEAIVHLPGGEQTFWGVPFSLGPEEGNRSWLVLGMGEEPIHIRLTPGQTASFILFTHFCNSSFAPDVGRSTRRAATPVMRPGEVLAYVVLIYTDGSEHRQPIRRRFEINEPMSAWGQLAFAARSHIEDSPLDYNGPYGRGDWGRKQTSVSQGVYKSQHRYWIYALPNPHPERNLQAVRLEATGADTVAVAGITLYHGREHPLRHRRLETVQIALPADERTLPEELPVEADLGIVARKYAPPPFDPETWLEAEPKGWGEEPPSVEPVERLLMDVTASPDATLQVGSHEVEMRDVYREGAAESNDGKVRLELLTPQKTWLHVTVVDDSTGLPTPVRVHFRAPDGRYFPPYGHRHEINDNWFEDYGGDLILGSTQYAYVDGRFQIELPVGECYVELSKGFEYEPVRAKLLIEAGQRELTLRMGRRFDFRQEGWVTADTHVHFISPQTAWLEAQAEGLNLVNLLASQWGDLFTNVADISGAASGASREDTIVWVGTENRQHLLGHMSLLGVKGDPVFPMCAGGPGESYLGDPLWTSMAEWADRCRAQEGVVVLPHFPNPYAEAVADIILGKIDGVEIRDFFTPPTLDTYGVREWYRFLNLGYRVAAVGGTDKMSAGMPVGGVRTYAHLDGGEAFTFASWGKAVRAGQTFTTSGPIIGMEVEGKGLGDEIRLPDGGGTLEAHAWARSTQPFDVLQLVVNGQVVAEERSGGDRREAQLKARLKVGGSSWIAARCLGALRVWHIWPIHIAAHTSPVYVKVGEGEQFNPSDATYMLTLLEGGLTWLDTLSIPADPQRQATVKKVFEDAQAQLHQRLHQHGHSHPH